MKKSVLLSLILSAFVLLGCSKSGDNTINSLQRVGLRGPVKSTETFTFDASMRFGEVEKGKLTQERDFHYSIAICASILDEYNKDGNSIKTTIKDHQGRIIQMCKSEYFKNDRVGYMVYDSDGELTYSSKHILKDNKPVSMDVYYRNSDYDSIVCVLDGFLPKAYLYYKNGNIDQKEEPSYENGLCISSVLTRQDGNNYYLEWEWDETGGLTRYRVSDVDDEKLVEDLTCDERGYLTHYTRRGTWEPEEIDYKLEYLSFDDHGNWTQRVIYKNHKPLYLQERTIVYY